MLPQVFLIDTKGKRSSPSQLHGQTRPVELGADQQQAVVGVSVVDSLSYLNNFYEYEIEIDPQLALSPDLRVDFPDIVVRREAPREELIRAFDAQLHEYCKTRFRLKIELLERDAWVASGKVVFTPRPWRQPGQVDVYEAEKHVNKKPYSPENWSEYRYQVDPKNFLRLLGGHMQTFVVWPGDRLPAEPTIICDFHWASRLFHGIPPTDRDPATVLKNVGEQTGLKFTQEKRKVPVLTITPR